MNLKKSILNTIVLSGLLFMFNQIYSLFAHGVSSLYMSYAWCWTLLLVGVYLVMYILDSNTDSFIFRIGYNSLNSGVAALVSGSLLKGICEIAGTNSNYILFFFIIGGILSLIGIIMMLSKSKQ